MKLTDNAILKLKAGDKEYTIWDESIPGFGVRVRTSGMKSFIAVERLNNRVKKKTLGQTDRMTVDTAKLLLDKKQKKLGT